MSAAILSFRQRPSQIGGGFLRRGPLVVVRPYGGHFAATVLRRCDGSETRLQIFPDRAAAARCARLLNSALAEARL